LEEEGAVHVARGEVWDGHASPGWRVTALLSARRLTACRRALFRMGASRVVGLPPRIVFDRDSDSTFDKLQELLTTEGRSAVDSG
jgi:ATP phosphoribosyltransferase